MAQTFTNKLEDFFDDNSPGGYIQTSVNISNDDLNERINTILNNKGYLTAASHLSWDNIDNKPNIPAAQVQVNWNSTSGITQILNKPNIPEWALNSTKPTYTAQEVGAMPNNGVSISNTLSAGEGRTRLATITINGTSTDIYGGNSSGNNAGGNISIESYYDGLALASINETDICMPSTYDLTNYVSTNTLDTTYYSILGTNILSELQITDNNNNIIEDYSNFLGIKNVIDSSSSVFLLNDYGYNTFGTNNFYVEYANENKHLIEDVFATINSGKNKIIFATNDGIWIADNFIIVPNFKGIIFNNLTTNILTQELGDNNTDILDNIEIYSNSALIIENQTTKVTYFKFFKNIKYLNANLFQSLFDYGRDLAATNPAYYPIATDIDMYDEDGYATWSRVVTTDYLEKRLRQL